MLTLKVEKRAGDKKPKALRKRGDLPAVFYGRKEESTPIVVNARDFSKVLKEAGESSIISLEGIGDAKEALIHDVDVHPVTGTPRHADFYVIEKGKKLNVNVPIEFVGESPAVLDLGGILVKVIHELEIEALPKDLPHQIEVDVSILIDLESQIAIKDLTLPEGVIALADGDETVAMVSEPKEEEEESSEIDMESIEVEGENADDEGEESGGDGKSKKEEDSS